VELKFAKVEVPSERVVFYASVTIDTMTFDVNYSTEENFLTLLKECSLEAYMNIPQPGAKG